MASLSEFRLPVLYFIVVFINNSFAGNLASTDNKCDGRYQGCCEGFLYDETLSRCIACNVGYFGENCSMKCPFPSFGFGCQNECNCTKDMCDFLHGCTEKSSVSENKTRENSEKRVLETFEMSTHSTLMDTTTGLIWLFIFLIGAYITFYVIQKQLVRKRKVTMEIENRENDLIRQNHCKI